MISRLVRKAVPIAKKVLPEQVYTATKVAFARLAWKLEGGEAPPSGIKARWIRHFQRLYSINVFVETGTCRGDMIRAALHNFKEIYSVELDEELHRFAKSRFARFSHVHLFQGSSDQVLLQLIPSLRERCLFWLDAHYSGGETARGELECPVLGELAALAQHPIKDHVILIDDANYFNGTRDHPAVEQVEARLAAINQGYRIEVRENLILAYVPPEPRAAAFAGVAEVESAVRDS
jgi:hypothetical protein